MATTAANPGNVVVPLSTILDQLQGKLTGSEIDALLLAVLGGRRQQVNPGDLITADLFNQILRDISDLSVRVAQLEGSTGGPAILSRLPAGDVRVHDRLTLLGTGFDPDRTLNTVRMGSVSITSFFEDSSDTQLAFQVPDLFTGLPRLVDVSMVTGGRTSNTVQVRVQPRTETQGGNVVILPRTEPLGQINVGDEYTLRWLVDGQTVLPASYRLRLVFTDVVGASESLWRSTLELDPSEEVQIVRGNPLAVSATLEVPSGATRAQIALEVQSTDGTMTRTSDPIPFVVGSTTQVSDPRANVTLPASIGPFDPSGSGPNPLRAARITVDGNQMDGLQLRFGQTGTIPFRLFVTSESGGSGAGDYAYSAEVENAGAAWQVTSVVPSADADVPVSATRTITVTLRNTDATTSSAIRYMVVRAQHTPADSATADFVSFIRFPIQGFVS
jgi:hypothetical protein